MVLVEDMGEAEVVAKVGRERGTCRTSGATHVIRWDTTRVTVQWWRQGDSIWQRRRRRLRYRHRRHRGELQEQQQVKHRRGSAAG